MFHGFFSTTFLAMKSSVFVYFHCILKTAVYGHNRIGKMLLESLVEVDEETEVVFVENLKYIIMTNYIVLYYDILTYIIFLRDYHLELFSHTGKSGSLHCLRQLHQL